MDFDQVKAVVDRALEDGKLTQAEIDEIVAAIGADNNYTVEELALLNSIHDKIHRGEIERVD